MNGDSITTPAGPPDLPAGTPVGPPRGAPLLRAIRGPIMLITLGVLLSVDHFGPYSFWRTWPILLILFGLFKLFERMGARQPS